MSDIAELLKQSLPEIVAILERKRHENERALIESICEHEAQGLSVRASAKLLGCAYPRVQRLRKKIRVRA